MSTGAQDPALFEDSPAVQAAVLEERRFNKLEGKLNEVLAMVTSLDKRVEIQNGRVATSEKVIEQVRDEHTVLRNQFKDRRLWERLDVIEAWRTARDKDAAHDDGVSEGKVSLRASDKAAFGVFLSAVVGIATAVLKFL